MKTLREIICAWCKKTKQIEVDEKEQSTNGYPSHGICEDCRRRLLEQA